MKIYPPVKSNNKSQVQIQKSQIFNCQVQIHFQSWESHEIMSGKKHSNNRRKKIKKISKALSNGYISVYVSMKDRGSVVLIGLILFLGESD